MQVVIRKQYIVRIDLVRLGGRVEGVANQLCFRV